MKIEPEKIYTFYISYGDSTQHYAVRGKNLSVEEKEMLIKQKEAGHDI